MTIEMPALTTILQMLLNGILIDRDELVHARENLLVRRLPLDLRLPSFHLALDFDEPTGAASLSFSQTSIQDQSAKGSSQSNARIDSRDSHELCRWLGSLR